MATSRAARDRSTNKMYIEMSFNMLINVCSFCSVAGFLEGWPLGGGGRSVVGIRYPDYSFSGTCTSDS